MITIHLNYKLPESNDGNHSPLNKISSENLTDNFSKFFSHVHSLVQSKLIRSNKRLQLQNCCDFKTKFQK